MDKKNIYLIAALICLVSSMAFRFENDKIKWLWADRKQTAFFLIFAAFALGIAWYKELRK
jgi:hypothetical protein